MPDMTGTVVIVMPEWLDAAFDIVLLVMVALVGREYRRARLAVANLRRRIDGVGPDA